ncbi:MAG: tetratricopeptide repeat protein, partial [Myxococcota bacterium]|nr:tetratricopeptide repeat protein [Myxococcota bacterium]
ATFGDAAAEDQRIERYAVMAAMGRLAADLPPRVYLLEEMDRADRGSLELAEYLIRNVVGEARGPALFVLTRAPHPDAEPDPLSELIAGESTGLAATEVVLGPIAASAVEELLLGILEDSADARTLALRLHGQGGGNPFFVTEMIRGLMEQGAIEVEDGGNRARLSLGGQSIEELVLPVPRTLREIIRKRLAPMSTAARRVALSLGVSRVDLDLDLLINVTALDEDSLNEALDELIASRLVRAERRGEIDHYELDRNRVADVLLDETPRGEVLRVHRRIADGLEMRYRRRADAVVEVLAHHYEQGCWPAKAVPYLMLAADKLIQRTFVAEGLTLLDRAGALEEEASRYLTLEDADRRRTELMLARANALVHLGRWTDGWGEAASAHLLAQELGDPRLLARTHIELATQARRQIDLDAATEHLKEALVLSDAVGDARLRIVPQYEAGAVAWIQGNLESARDYFGQAQAGAEAASDERAMVLGANGLGLIALCRGQSAEARRCFTRSVEIAERFGLMDRLSTARANLIEVYHLTGNLRKGIELADRAVAHAREVRHLHGIGTGLRYRVLMLTDLGRGMEAIDNAEEALRIQEGLDNGDDVLSVLVVLLRAFLASGRTDRAHELLDRALDLSEHYDSEGFLPLLLAWRARLLVDGGEEEAARAVLSQIAAAEGRRWPHQQVRLSLNLARVRERLGEPELARPHAEEALRTADASGFRFYAMRARQILARIADEPSQAARHGRVGDALA